MSKLNNISVDGTVYNINDFHVIKNNSYNNPFIITEHEPGIYIVDSSEANYLPGKLYAKYIDSEDYNVRTEYYDGFLCLTDTSIDDPYTYKNIGYIFDASAGLAYPCVTQPAPWGFSLTGASSGIGNSAVKTIGNQTIYGKKVFNTLPESSVIPTTNNQLVNKKYVDELGVKVGTSVDNNYRVNVLHSKNLLNYTISSATNLGVTVSMIDGSITLNGTTTGAGDIYSNTTNTILLKAGTYTISATKISGSFNSQDTGIYIRKISDGRPIFDLTAPNNYTKVTTLTLSEDTLVRVHIYTNGSGMEFSNLVINLQIEKGNTATDFEIPVTPSINVDGEEIYSKGVTLYDGGTAGSDLSSPISFNDSLANYEKIEIYYGTSRPYYISSFYSNYGQHTYFEPSLQFYYLSNADSSFYIYITLLSISQNAMELHPTRGSRTVTVSSSGAITNTKSTTSSTIKIFKVIGYK